MDISGFLVVFLSQDSDTAKTSGLAEFAKAVSKTNLADSIPIYRGQFMKEGLLIKVFY
jgi:hypothetical protein